MDTLNLATVDCQSKKNIWKSHTQHFIHHTLNDFATRIKIGWQVEQFTKGEDADVVKIGFAQKNVSIENERNGTRNITKYGGHLAFCTLYNGDVSVILSYGYFEDGEIKSHVRYLESVSPEVITQQYVGKKIEAFLSGCKPWETC